MMMDRGCPGQDRSNWTPDDIFEMPCTNCGATIEFFKDDAKRVCAACGACNANPKMDIGCAAWCAAAEKCSTGRQWLAEDSLADTPAFGDPT